MQINRKILTVGIAISLILCQKITVAQSQQVEDVLYLKNGGIIRGTILEINTERKIKVEITGRNVFVFDMDEVERIVREQVPQAVSVPAPAPPAYTDYNVPGQLMDDTTAQEQGYMGTFGPSLYIGGTEFASRVIPGFHWVNGYQFKGHYYAGIGIGVESYINNAFLPLFAEGRYTFFKGERQSPYVFGRGGFLLPPGQDRNWGWGSRIDHKGGGLLEIGGGLTKYFGRSAGITFGIGYRYHQINYKRWDWDWVTGGTSLIEVKEIYHRGILRLCLLF